MEAYHVVADESVHILPNQGAVARTWELVDEGSHVSFHPVEGMENAGYTVEDSLGYL